MSRTAGHLTAVCKRPEVLYKSLFHTHTHADLWSGQKTSTNIYRYAVGVYSVQMQKE